MSSQFHKLEVLAIENPIEAASTITFSIPAHLLETFRHYPGQHLTIKFHIDGNEVRRSYSLNSCPFKETPLQITVKRVAEGVVSNYMGDHLKVGDQVEVSAPQGRFYADVKEDDYKTYFLFAAGSGITPIFSILQSVLIASPNSSVCLLYGNTNQDTIIFKHELDKLKAQHPERLQVVHILSEPKVWTTWEQWEGRKGRIDTKAIEWFITQHPPVAQSTEYYICGPGAMNTSVRDTLLELGVPKQLIHLELFGASSDAADTKIAAIDNAQLTALVNGQSYQCSVPKGNTILHALKEIKAEPPHSCESGVCGTCVAKVTKGRVQMKACMALDNDEITSGLILTCQALPMTKEVLIEYSK